MPESLGNHAPPFVVTQRVASVAGHLNCMDASTDAYGFRSATERPHVVSSNEWDAGTLTALFVEAGCGGHLARRFGTLFLHEPPTPTPNRPGAPQHPESECLIWRGSYRGTGYGQVMHAGRNRAVHSVAYELANPDAPPLGRDLVLAHLCERRECANPSHVRPVTQQVNSAEGRARRYPRSLLDCAPQVRCEGCGRHMTPTVQRRRGTGRPAWRLSCSPCIHKFRRESRRMGYAIGSLYSGSVTRAMSDDEYAKYQQYQSRQPETHLERLAKYGLLMRDVSSAWTVGLSVQEIARATGLPFEAIRVLIDGAEVAS